MLCRGTSPVLCMSVSYTTHKRIMCKEAVFILLALAVHTQTTRLEINDSYKSQSTESKWVCDRKFRFSLSGIQGCTSLGEVSRSLEETQCPNVQGPLQSFERPVTAHPVTQRHNQEYLNPHKQPGENSKSREVDTNFLQFVV